MDMAQLKKEYNSMVYALGKLELQFIDINNLKKNLLEEITSVVKNIKKLEREEEAKKAEEVISVAKNIDKSKGDMENSLSETNANDDKKDIN